METVASTMTSANTNVSHSSFTDIRGSQYITSVVHAITDKNDPNLRNYDNPDGRVWSIYSAESGKEDRALVQSWKGDMDGMLIFAGLFSACVTAFIIESLKLLKPDSAVTQTLQQQATSSLNLSQLNVQLGQKAFQPSTPAILVNAFWFLSLSSSVSCALSATLLQRWACRYLQTIERSCVPHHRARIRSYFYEGVKKFHLETIAEAIPALQHAAVFFFLAGLFVFVLPIDTIIAYIILGVTITSGVAYLTFSILPVLYFDSPFHTPLSPALWRVIQSLRLLRYSNGVGKTMLVDGNMSRGREVVAMVESASLRARDREALRWTIDRLTENSELEPFLEGIPGFLQSGDVVDGATTFRTLLQDEDLRLGHRISRFLESCLNPTSFLEPHKQHQSNSSMPSSNQQSVEDTRRNRALTGLTAIVSLTKELQELPWQSCFGSGAKYVIHHLMEDDSGDIAHAALCTAAIVADRLSYDLLLFLRSMWTTPLAQTLSPDEVKHFLSLEGLGGFYSLAKVVGVDVEREGWLKMIDLLRMSLKPDDTISRAADPKVDSKFQQVLNTARVYELQRFLKTFLTARPLAQSNEGHRLTAEAFATLTAFNAGFIDNVLQVALVQGIGELVINHGQNGMRLLSSGIIDTLLSVFFSIKDQQAISEAKRIVGDYVLIEPSSRVAKSLSMLL